MISFPLAFMALTLGAPETWVQVRREIGVMGTTLVVEVRAANRRSGIEGIERAFASVRQIDGLLSTWRADSEIARLNRAPLRSPVSLSPDLASLLAEAAEWSIATDGAFDPGIGSLIDAWQLRGAGRRPTAEMLRQARQTAGVRHFPVDGGHGQRLADGWLDTGAFGKGAALRAASAALDSAGIQTAFLNFGGQILVIGDSARLVPVAHPSRRTDVALSIRLTRGSVSTTSQSERFVTVNGTSYGHVLDPRSGIPVPAWGSVTVVARDPMIADLLSTALFVMGPDAGLRWAEERKDIGALFLIERAGGLEVRTNRTMREFLTHDQPHQGD